MLTRIFQNRKTFLINFQARNKGADSTFLNPNNFIISQLPRFQYFGTTDQGDLNLHIKPNCTNR